MYFIKKMPMLSMAVKIWVRRKIPRIMR